MHMQWMKNRLDELGKRPIELARHLNVAPPRVYEMLTGKRRLQLNEVGPTAAFLEWPEATVLAHLGASSAPITGSKRPAQRMLQDEREVRSSLEVWASAEGREGTMLISTDPIDYIIRPAGLPARGSFAVYLIGDLMAPALETGDQLFVSPNKPARSGADCLFAQELDDGTLLAFPARLVDQTADSWRVQQFNPSKEFDLDRRSWPKAWPIVGKMNRP